jgi:hypothetical protein
MDAVKAKEIHDLAVQLRQKIGAVLPPLEDTARDCEPFDTLIHADFYLLEVVNRLGHPALEDAASTSSS